MKPQELFGVGVRLAGLFLLLLGVDRFVTVLLTSLTSQSSGPGGVYVHAGLLVLVGLFLIARADKIVTLAYPDAERGLWALMYRLVVGQPLPSRQPLGKPGSDSAQ